MTSVGAAEPGAELQPEQHRPLAQPGVYLAFERHEQRDVDDHADGRDVEGEDGVETVLGEHGDGEVSAAAACASSGSETSRVTSSKLAAAPRTTTASDPISGYDAPTHST
ncbi:hypothetical protein ACFO0N_00390 [Halobium salinum]|uniref:Uncharacterized protein n=1 Tax=Halobium salinum TaxID=1364940 RepID=A0ABD5P6Q1_9EURY|nr:hypothetical protein [Halobium salinum]